MERTSARCWIASSDHPTNCNRRNRAAPLSCVVIVSTREEKCGELKFYFSNVMQNTDGAAKRRSCISINDQSSCQIVCGNDKAGPDHGAFVDVNLISSGLLCLIHCAVGSFNEVIASRGCEVGNSEARCYFQIAADVWQRCRFQVA